MKKVLILGLLIITLIVLPLLTACEENATPTSGATATPTGANWWDKFGEPQYGGTITTRQTSVYDTFDNYEYLGASYQVWLETLWLGDWKVDRDEFSFQTVYIPPEYMQGNLAESWELPDAQTIIVNLRQGVRWQDKPPANGREFTADDVQQHYDRILGTGSGYTTPSPQYAGFTGNLEKVNAIDKYTVEIKFKNPGAILLTVQDVFGYNMIEAPEAVKAEGGMADWKNAVGTGPWILQEYEENSSITCVRNSNYWGYDECHPENQLPYADTFRVLFIPDEATSQAALRTGKIDLLEGVAWQQADSLLKTNPELQKAASLEIGPAIHYRCDTAPFTDINVRRALQLAINLEDIANSYYGGTVEATPVGFVSPLLTGYYYPYSQWSQELKDEYSYNPEKAIELLTAAGYPDGFETNVVAPTNQDLTLLEALKSYLNDINVDMEINVMDTPVWAAYVAAGKQDQMSYYGGTAYKFPPTFTVVQYFSGNTVSNYSCVKDPGYDEIFARFNQTTDTAKLGPILTEADKYVLENHWSLFTLPTPSFYIYQPYLKGYSGEYLSFNLGYYMARCWVNQ